MADKLFGNRIEPACAYCRYGRSTVDRQMVLCGQVGVVYPYHHCRRYRYAPLKREPSRQPVLPSYNKEDFEL